MTAVSDDISRALLDYIDASPSPYHAVANAVTRLETAGFSELSESEPWSPSDVPGGRFVRRGGSLVAWKAPSNPDPSAGFRIVGAHTDSPNLRIKPRPDSGRVGWRQLGVEIYGGALLNSWLDRDLGLSGEVVVRSGNGAETRLLHVGRPILRVPQLAIHLDREIAEKGLQLNKQNQMAPVWALGDPTDGDFLAFLAAELGVDSVDLLSWTVMTHDLTPGTLLGLDQELLAAPRIDNQASCFAAVEALSQSEGTPVGVICLFDHEEVGSVSATGAGGSLLPGLLARLSRGLGHTSEDHDVALASSLCVSADGAHATHPNYSERHDPEHNIAVNGGPVIKLNANERYATGAGGAAAFQLACEQAGVAVQWFVNRTDLACGSTIGPITAAQLGVPTVDVGMAQLSMHSARELCGADDPAQLVESLGAFFAPAT